MFELHCTVLCTHAQRLGPDHSNVRLYLHDPERKMNALLPIKHQTFYTVNGDG